MELGATCTLKYPEYPKQWHQSTPEISLLLQYHKNVKLKKQITNLENKLLLNTS